MPFAASYDFEEKDRMMNDGQNVSGQSTSFDTNVPGQQMPNAKKGGPKSSGAYANIQDYLNANQEQGAALGDKVAQNISGVGNTARTSINQAQSDFTTKVDEGSLANWQTAKDEASGLVNKAATKDYQTKLGDDELSRFKEIGTAQYKGPSDLYEAGLYDTTKKNVDKATDYYDLANTESGRYSLLSEMLDRPKYNQGQKNLDNILLTGSDANKQKMLDARNSLAGIGDEFTNLYDTTSALANERKNAISDIANSAVSGLTSTRGQRVSDVDSRLNDVQNQWANKYNDLINAISAHQGFTQEQAKDLGLNQFAGTYGIFDGAAQPQSFLTLDAYDSNKAISKDEFGQLNALDQLANQVNLGELSRFSNEQLAGSQDLKSNINNSKIIEAINQAKTPLDKERVFLMSLGNQDYDVAANILRAMYMNDSNKLDEIAKSAGVSQSNLDWIKQQQTDPATYNYLMSNMGRSIYNAGKDNGAYDLTGVINRNGDLTDDQKLALMLQDISSWQGPTLQSGWFGN